MVSKATCAGPICEVLSLRRGLGPHHARREHVGTWETSPRPQPSVTVQGRDGKPRRRSRQGRCEESDGVVVPMKRPNKAGMTSGGGRGGKDPARKDREWTATASGLSAGLRLTSAALAHGPAYWHRPVSRSRCTSGRSPVRESRTPGSARGAGSNSRPYRNSHDRPLILGADAVPQAEGNMLERVIASARVTRRGLRPWHVRTLLAWEPGDLQPDRRGSYSPAARIGKARSRSR
jgi:hypothetical protein